MCLADKDDLPVACEYMDRDAIDVVDEAGRVLCHSLLRPGIGPSTMKMWNAKLWVEAHGGGTLPDLCLHYANKLFARLSALADRGDEQEHDHHLLASVGSLAEMERVEGRQRRSWAAEHGKKRKDGKLASSFTLAQDDTDAEQRVGMFRFAAAALHSGHGALGVASKD